MGLLKNYLGIIFSSVMVFTCPLLAQEIGNSAFEAGGHIKTQFTYLDSSPANVPGGPNAKNDLIVNELDLRIKLKKRTEKLEFQFEGQALSLFSEASGLSGSSSNSSNSAVIGVLPRLTTDNRRLFQFTAQAIDEENQNLVIRPDRLSVSYLRQQFVFKAGRQAISWGNGLVFQVLDPFNPFSPTEVDRDYKTGDDMLYSQWLFSGGEDLQGLVLVRRNPDTHAISSDQSSYAIKFHGRSAFSGIDYDVLLARHYDEPLIGLGSSMDLEEAILRYDLVFVEVEGQGWTGSFLLNVDRSFLFFDKNIYGYLEYFHNGVGVSSSHYGNPDQALIKRLRRGELFTLNKDYFSSGFRVEWKPWFNSFLATIINLRDSSGFFQFREELDWIRNTLLSFGANIPFGSSGSEYGGFGVPVQTLPGLENQQVLFTPPGSIFIRFAFFI